MSDVTLDPWTFFGVEMPPECGVPPTPKQRAMLERVEVSAPASKRQASALIGAIIDRTKVGLCTYRQAVCLLRAGKRMDVRAMTFDAAQDAISEMVETEPGDAWGVMMDPFGGVL